jgi:hypothetical protein
MKGSHRQTEMAKLYTQFCSKIHVKNLMEFLFFKDNVKLNIWILNFKPKFLLNLRILIKL